MDESNPPPVAATATSTQSKNSAILAVDIGTTNLKCSLFNSKLEIINSNTVMVFSFYILLNKVFTFALIIENIKIKAGDPTTQRGLFRTRSRTSNAVS